jgi:hypothetical protein
MIATIACTMYSAHNPCVFECIQVEVQVRMMLSEETLMYAVHFLDRFLERRVVARTRLQLVGCVALLIASKYEEVVEPKVHDYVSIGNGAYTSETVIAMEGLMLTALNYNLIVPLPINFLNYYATVCGVDAEDEVSCLALYYLELTLQVYEFLEFPPSSLAAAAFYLAMATFKHARGQRSEAVWNLSQQQRIGYTSYQLRDVVPRLHSRIKHADQDKLLHKSVKKKFATLKFRAVSKYSCVSLDMFHADVERDSNSTNSLPNIAAVASQA